MNYFISTKHRIEISGRYTKPKVVLLDQCLRPGQVMDSSAHADMNMRQSDTGATLHVIL